jgi:hypothetical protein
LIKSPDGLLRLDQERGKIAVAEALKAKRLVETDLDARARKLPTSTKYSGGETSSWPKPSVS